MMSPGPDDAARRGRRDDEAMARTRTKQLRELRVNAGTTVLVVRTFGPRIATHLFESLEIGERLRRRRMSSRERRLRRSLKFGAYVVGVTAVGAVAARRVVHDGPDSPELGRL
jgi:hypothetical protein